MARNGLTLGAVAIAAIVALGTSAVIGRAKAQGASPPDLSGNYKCQPDPTPCLWSGQTPSISQSGNKLDIKNDKGETASATLTSDITISAGGPMNSYGTVRPDHSISWSNGNQWQKQ